MKAGNDIHYFGVVIVIALGLVLSGCSTKTEVVKETVVVTQEA